MSKLFNDQKVISLVKMVKEKRGLELEFTNICGKPYNVENESLSLQNLDHQRVLGSQIDSLVFQLETGKV